jgi:hypothetical protein
VPEGLEFEVWSGKHQVAAAKSYLHEEMIEVLNSVEVLPVGEELKHECAFGSLGS